MAFQDCLTGDVKDGTLDRADADRLGRMYDDFRERAAQGGTVNADEEAKRLLLEELTAEAAEKKRRAGLTLKMVTARTADINAFRNSHGERDVAEAAAALIEHAQPGGRGRIPYSSVAGRHKAIVGWAQAEMGSLLRTFSRQWLTGGRLNRAVLANVVREAFGEETGDVAAKELAATWSRVAEGLRQRFNAAGGAIGQLEHWGLPQWHDPVALRKFGKSAWVAHLLPRLDADRMVDGATARPLTRARLVQALEDMWDGVVTDVWDTREPTMVPFGRGSLATRRAEHRFLVFKDAATWLEYQRDFGGGSDPFATMMAHINGMARDIAAMEILGPNPDAGVAWLKQLVTKEAAKKTIGRAHAFAGRGNIEARVKRYEALIDNLWGAERGTLNSPVNSFWAGFFGGARSFISSTAMGAAILSSGGDLGTSLVTRRFAGIGGSVFNDLIHALTPASRQEAVEAGLILDSAQHVLHAQARYVGTLGGPEWARFLGERVLHLSGLTAYTQAGKHAFGLAFQLEAAKQVKNGAAAMSPLLRSRFAQYGFGEKEIAKLGRAARHQLGNGVEILRPKEVAAIDPVLADRYIEMIQTETQYAVPEGTLRSHIGFIDGTRPGTFAGEALRSFAQFKSFGAVYAMLHGQRIAAMLMAREQRQLGLAYAASLFVASTLFGALALQLKAVAGGRDPRDMGDPKFWAAAGIQGAGFGILGDFLFADASRDGAGLAQTLGGPLLERADSFRNYVIANSVLLGGDLADATQGKPVDWNKLAHSFGSSSVRLASQNLPGGNLWYTQLALRRMLFDQVQWLADPEANKAFKRQQQYWQKGYGQEFWWQPGQSAPQRAPNAAAMAGG